MSQQNHLLSSLSSADLGLIQPHLESADLPLRLQIEEPNKPIQWVYFPHTGICSVVATAKRDRHIEVGIIGQDALGGDQRAPANLVSYTSDLKAEE
jgi:hypothetical protein